MVGGGPKWLRLVVELRRFAGGILAARPGAQGALSGTRTSGVSYSSENDEFLLLVSLERARLRILNRQMPSSGFLTPSRSVRTFCSLAMVSSLVCFGRSKT